MKRWMIVGTILAGLLGGAAAFAVEAEPDLAVVQRRAEAQDPEAQFDLGMMFSTGRGVPRSDTEAFRWFRLAAENGLRDAMYNLGVLYASGVGVKADDKEAVKWFERAAALADPDAQFNLGVLHAAGRGVARNPAKAVEYYRQAADQGLAYAQFNLGKAYETGFGVARSETHAIALYQKAAAQGDVDARYVLGEKFERSQNLKEAQKWYLLAAEQGSAKALKRLEQLDVQAGLAAAVTKEPALEPADQVDIEVAPAAAQPNPQAVALVIGLEHYSEKEKVPPVKFAGRDAALFRSYVTRTLGVEESNVFFLTDQEATLASFRKMLGDKGKLAKWTTKKTSDVYVYYAGHGIPGEDEKAFLVPYDGDPKYPADTCLALEDLYESLGKLEARSVTVVLDACFSGQSGRTWTNAALIPDARRLGVVTKGVHVPAGVTVFAAAKSNQMSFADERQQHGLFTYYFLRGLRGEADQDGDRAICVQELQEYVQASVSKRAQRLDAEQTPVMFGVDSRRILRKL